MLVYLQSPSAAAKGMALIARQPRLGGADGVWPQPAGACLMWMTAATAPVVPQGRELQGRGASFDKFIEFIRNDSLATFTEAEKTQLSALIAMRPESKLAIENLGAMFIGRTPTMWTLDELEGREHGIEEPQLRQRTQDVRCRRLLHLPSLRQPGRHDRPRPHRRRRTLQPGSFPARSNHQPQQGY